jgi:hypothetical protein
LQVGSAPYSGRAAAFVDRRVSGNSFALGIAALALVLLLARHVSADASRLMLVDPDPELEAAVRAALGAWDTTVVAERTPGPGSTMPGSEDRARVLARERDVEAVVWISRSSEGLALWMYDAKGERVVTRRLPVSPPFDAPTAASVALMIKTLLRHSVVPPSGERLEPAAAEPWLRVALLAGVRPKPTTLSRVEGRFGAAATAWPSWPGGPLELGAGVEISSGPGLAVAAPSFEGRWTETLVLASLNGRLKLGSDLDLTVIGSSGFDVTRIEGAVVGPPGGVGAARTNAVVALHSELGYRLGRTLRPALRLGFVRPLRTQSYFVHGERVLGVAPVMLQALFVLEMGLL